MSTGKGFAAAVRAGGEIGCTAIQVFTSSPRMWKGGGTDPEKAVALREATAETGVPVLLSHDTYLVNLCAAGEEVAAKSGVCLKEELTRSAGYGIPMVVSHLGASVGCDEAQAYGRAAAAVKEALAETPETVTLLAETTAGQGSSLNARFEDLARLIELTGAPERLGVCFDTCHVFAAGYDLRTPEAVEATLAEFDRIVGLDRLRAVHLNDSKHGLGSRKDRHANIGQGEIGEAGLRHFVLHARLHDVPMFLETPAEDDGHARDLTRIREWGG